ncbi:MAG: hypothetical protein IJ553_02625 [Alloprevotella sp.]|nr:hypothetical protein [Alloprevotella sp.]
MMKRQLIVRALSLPMKASLGRLLMFLRAKLVYLPQTAKETVGCNSL